MKTLRNRLSGHPGFVRSAFQFRCYLFPNQAFHFSKSPQKYLWLNFCCKDSKHQGMPAVAAGWGRWITLIASICNCKLRKLNFEKLRRFMLEQEGQEWTSKQSPVLKKVDLRVSTKNYKHLTILGTEVTKDKNGVFEDPCSGDSGGPLMYQDKSSLRWTLIGQIRPVYYHH